MASLQLNIDLVVQNDNFSALSQINTFAYNTIESSRLQAHRLTLRSFTIQIQEQRE